MKPDGRRCQRDGITKTKTLKEKNELKIFEERKTKIFK